MIRRFEDPTRADHLLLAAVQGLLQRRHAALAVEMAGISARSMLAGRH